MSESFSDSVLVEVMRNAPLNPSQTEARFRHRDYWKAFNGMAECAVTGYEMALYDRSVIITIEARIRSSHGPSARHEWVIRAESDQSAFALARAGIYNKRESEVDPGFQRKHFLSGESRMERYQ